MKLNVNNPVTIPAEKLKPFEGHPYKVQDNEEMNNLIESIREQGILSPLIVRPLENTKDEYEVISGHRRLHAAMKAGLKTVPAFVYDIDRDTAAVMVVDSNLHREHILPSEKAFSYKLKYEALKHQGKRTDLTSSQFATKFDTAEIIGNISNESRDTVYRYLRLTNLIPELLDLMDNGRIAFSVGVELSYIEPALQLRLYDLIVEQDCTPSYSQAWNMHREQNNGTLTFEKIVDIFCVEKPNQKPVYKVQAEKLSKFIKPDISPKQAEDFIIKACEYYSKYLIRKRDKDAR